MLSEAGDIVEALDLSHAAGMHAPAQLLAARLGRKTGSEDDWSNRAAELCASLDVNLSAAAADARELLFDGATLLNLKRGAGAPRVAPIWKSLRLTIKKCRSGE